LLGSDGWWLSAKKRNQIADGLDSAVERIGLASRQRAAAARSQVPRAEFQLFAVHLKILLE